MINDNDAESYRERGYLVVPDVLDAATVRALRSELTRIVEGARGVTAHTDVSSRATASTIRACAA
jgi:hypothetical protein